MSDKERELFEAHIEKTEGSKPRLWAQVFASSQNNPALPAHLEGVYFMRETQKAWLAWQQRGALDAPVASTPFLKERAQLGAEWVAIRDLKQAYKTAPPSAQELSDEAIHLEWVLHRPMIRGGARSGSIIEFARAILAAEANGLSASAMRMMWDDQSLEEKNHYLAAAKAQGGSHAR